MSTVYTVYQWLIISQQVINLSKRWLSYGHVPSRTAGCKKPMRCLRKQGDISGCETKTSHSWGADTSYHFHILWSWLVSSKRIPRNARRPWRQSPHTKILLGCLTAADQNQLISFKKQSQLPWYRWISIIVATETHHGQWCFSIHRCLPRDS